MVINKKVFHFIKPSVCIFFEPKSSSSLINEGLFGESVEILNEKEEFFYIKLLTDKYKGWVYKNSLGTLPLPTHRVVKLRSNIYKQKDIKKPIIHYLPFGSMVSVISTTKTWAKIGLNSSYKNRYGFIPKQDLIDLKDKIDNWVEIAKMFLGVPYKWGGRDSMGIDCSALVQLSLIQTLSFPRDTKMQVQNNLKKLSFNEIKKGCLVFWKGHVGIMLDKLNILHANAYSMQVNVEKLEELDKRPSTKIENIISIVEI